VSDAGKAKEFSGQIDVGEFLAEQEQVEADGWHEMVKESPGEKRLGRDAEERAREHLNR
jgi:hypothetical protein